MLTKSSNILYMNFLLFTFLKMDFAFRKMFYEEHKSLYLSENILSPIKKNTLGIHAYKHTNTCMRPWKKGWQYCQIQDSKLCFTNFKALKCADIYT